MKIRPTVWVSPRASLPRPLNPKVQKMPQSITLEAETGLPFPKRKTHRRHSDGEEVTPALLLAIMGLDSKQVDADGDATLFLHYE